MRADAPVREVGARRPLRAYVFVAAYPSAYKPYYDSQFADLLRSGHDVRIFTFESLDRVVNPKVVEHGLAERTRRFFPGELRRSPEHLARMAAGVLDGPIARARAAARVAGGAGGVVEGARRVGQMLTVPAEAPDLCLVHGLRTATCVTWLRDLYPGVPTALYYHGGEPSEAGELSAGRVAAAFRAADVVFTNTEFSRADAVARGCEPERVVVLPVGFDVADYAPPEPRRYRAGGTLRLVSAGRLSEGKGHLLALRAVAEMVAAGRRELRYTILGDGPMRPALEAFVAEHSLGEHVVLAGARPSPEVVRTLGESDAMVLSSYSVGTWTETQAAIVQEALLMEAVTVTTRTGGVPESIPDAMRPLSVAPGDAAALRGALEAVYRLDADGLRDLGRRGRAWALEHYDISTLNRRMLEVILDRGAGARRDDPLPARDGSSLPA